MHRRIFSLAALAAGLVSVTATADSGFRYAVSRVTVTALPNMGGTESEARAINNGGHIVGYSTDPGGNYHGLLHLSTSTIDLGEERPGSQTVANGINNFDYVVGVIDAGDGARAFLWRYGTVIELDDGAASEPGVTSYATAINDRGDIVGGRVRPAPFNRQEATLWTSPTTSYRLQDHWNGGSTFGRDINSSAVVVGRDGNLNHGKRWIWSSSGTVTSRVPGPPSFLWQYVDTFGVNNHGIVVGYADTDGVYNTRNTERAIWWDGVSYNSVDIGVIPGGNYSVADDVNDGMFIIGYGDQPLRIGSFSFRVEYAFLYHSHFGFRVLPRLSSTPLLGACRPLALNERRTANGLLQVVGYCDTASGKAAVRWDVTVDRRSTTPPGTTP